ncbi:PaaI family thioesterase [Rhodococcus sp. T7]|uniref:PaaI family thioesterase n=1 Tax=Rhodococcus sp. T7 TaxID=627444 RepID=UPI00135AC4C3|nr:PaaI family thioesterase [Rhodococcus sp. T7]KAF0966004.1 1,4-dihydroxy-2-naphthoyl-CoA hydrolase [Rhodococcus sp. T7]
MVDSGQQQAPNGDGHGDTAALADQLGKGFDALIGLEYLELGPDRVRAQWTVTPDLQQPAGIQHGGVYCSVIESVASTAGSVWLGGRGHVVGVNNNTDFLRATREGTLTAEASPVHRGRTQQLWEVRITDEQDRLVSKGQVRLANITDTGRLGN